MKEATVARSRNIQTRGWFASHDFYPFVCYIWNQRLKNNWTLGFDLPGLLGFLICIWWTGAEISDFSTANVSCKISCFAPSFIEQQLKHGFLQWSPLVPRIAYSLILVSSKCPQTYKYPISSVWIRKMHIVYNINTTHFLYSLATTCRKTNHRPNYERTNFFWNAVAFDHNVLLCPWLKVCTLKGR